MGAGASSRDRNVKAGKKSKNVPQMCVLVKPPSACDTALWKCSLFLGISGSGKTATIHSMCAYAHEAHLLSMGKAPFGFNTQLSVAITDGVFSSRTGAVIGTRHLPR